MPRFGLFFSLSSRPIPDRRDRDHDRDRARGSISSSSSAHRGGGGDGGSSSSRRHHSRSRSRDRRSRSRSRSRDRRGARAPGGDEPAQLDEFGRVIDRCDFEWQHSLTGNHCIDVSLCIFSNCPFFMADRVVLAPENVNVRQKDAGVFTSSRPRSICRRPHLVFALLVSP